MSAASHTVGGGCDDGR
ncbi:Protein of unknown function [Propionibacterium freudenreichii]|nr:Protein of unknown function [Propionibacterium freudenreichii subsp. freudenreichii]CEG86343.1 Protein of unknown function [Propionibacterium freudenreichii]CEG91388.1 Protein of unknown function [Propionibacterium freudenreichii]CEH01702.1 Protein of unknown function [Propionibacterium freudenreichii]CEH08332.1 Protein of unknown function [Propionibacterium freudenreichii]